MKFFLKALFTLLAIVVVIGFILFNKKSDLRPKGYQYPNNTEKARKLLIEMGEAHQINKWNEIESYQVIFQDQFHGFIGKQAHPFKEQDVTFSLDYFPNTDTGRMEFLTGEQKGTVWACQNGETYLMNEAGQLVKEKNKDMAFWIPTYQYFIEFPLRIQEATIVDYIGTKTIAGIETKGVIASWDTVKPQKGIDQYIIWINAESKLIEQVDYTIRDAYPFLTGGAYMGFYVDFGDMLLPETMPVESNLLKKKTLHTMNILEFNPIWKSGSDMDTLINHQ